MNFILACKREILVSLRQPRLIIHALLFFVMLMIFFPLSLTYNSFALRELLPALIWTGILLSSLLFAEQLFQREYEEGVLEFWVVSGYPLPKIIGAKLLVSWLLLLLPLLLVSFLIALVYNLAIADISILLLALSLGTPAIFCLAALAAAFALAFSQKGMLMSLILLPLALPLMIFASAASRLDLSLQSLKFCLSMIAAFSLLTLGLLPFVLAIIIKNIVRE